MRKPVTAPTTKPVDAVVEVEGMITRLGELAGRERDSKLRGEYRAAIERLGTLSQRISERHEKPVVIGLPAVRKAIAARDALPGRAGARTAALAPRASRSRPAAKAARLDRIRAYYDQP